MSSLPWETSVMNEQLGCHCVMLENWAEFLVSPRDEVRGAGRNFVGVEKNGGHGGSAAFTRGFAPRFPRAGSLPPSAVRREKSADHHLPIAGRPAEFPTPTIQLRLLGTPIRGLSACDLLPAGKDSAAIATSTFFAHPAHQTRCGRVYSNGNHFASDGNGCR
jgi:hypothetical protein